MLQSITNKFKITLASKSPRRKELLNKIIEDFDIQVKPVKEVYPKELIKEEIDVQPLPFSTKKTN